MEEESDYANLREEKILLTETDNLEVISSVSHLVRTEALLM